MKWLKIIEHDVMKKIQIIPKILISIKIKFESHCYSLIINLSLIGYCAKILRH